MIREIIGIGRHLPYTALEYLLPGLKEFIFGLKEKGFLIGVLNFNPQFMMDTLKESLPLDFTIGTQLEFKDGVATGRIIKGSAIYIGFDPTKKESIRNIARTIVINKNPQKIFFWK